MILNQMLLINLKGRRSICHEGLRRFIKIVSDHVNIKNIGIYKENFVNFTPIKIPLDVDKISDILGISGDKKLLKRFA